MRLTPFVSGEYYHLYNRGNSKQKIFNNRNDHERFRQLLYIANCPDAFHFSEIDDVYNTERSGRLVSIGAYCLMPNHFHILVTPLPDKDDGISKFMKKLGTSYSMYFNTRYERVGSLFEGRFRSKHLDSDRYLKYIFSYIHLNPLKIIDKEWRNHKIDTQKSWNFLESYKYSSLADYLDTERKEGKILNKEDFPDYFPTMVEKRKELFGWLNSPEDRPRGN